MAGLVVPLPRRWVAVHAGMLCASLLLFVRGFLLTRIEVADRSQCNDNDNNGDLGAATAADGCWMPRRFDTAVFVIIDALRYDFAAPDAQVDEHSEAYRGHMPVIGQFLEQQPRNSRLYRFIADGPTTTLQRLKGLTTGSLPTFIDVSSNFNSDAIEEDNWIAQLGKHGWHLSFSGDDTWTKVFPRGFTEAHPYPSFNVKDLHGVDNGVIKHLLPAVRERMKVQSAARDSTNASRPVGSIVIGHYLGVDHVGHRFGPTHPEMKTKLEQMNSELNELLETVDEHTVVFVMGDHGMTDTGDHGGETRDEVDAALFAYTPAGFGHPPSSALGLGFGTAGGMGSMYQTDLVPTLALALGVPIPFGNLGGALTELILPPSIGESNDDLQWISWTIVALNANAQQVWRYLESYQAKSNAFPPETLAQFSRRMAAIRSSYEALGLNISGKLTDTLTYRAALSEDDVDRYHQVAVELASLLRDAAALCRKHFATFDMGDMIVGLLAMFVTLTSAVTAGLATLCLSLRSNFVPRDVTEVANEVHIIPSSPMRSFVRSSGPSAAELDLGPPAMPPTYSSRKTSTKTTPIGSIAWDLSLGSAGCISVLIWLGGDGFGRSLFLGSVSAIASCSFRRFITPVVCEQCGPRTQTTIADVLTSISLGGQWQVEGPIGAAMIITMHALSCLSNSFVDAEPEVIRYLLSTGIVLFLVRRVYALKPNGQQRSHALRLAALLLVVVRIASSLTVRASHEKLESIATRRVEGYMPLDYSEELVNQYVGSSRWLMVGLEILGVAYIQRHRARVLMSNRSSCRPHDSASMVHCLMLCVCALAVLCYWIELRINTQHSASAAVSSQNNADSTLASDGVLASEGVAGVQWHLLLPRISYVALLAGLLSLASDRSFRFKTWRVRLAQTTSLLLVLNALLLGPLSPPALISMSIQCWLLLELRKSLQCTYGNAATNASSRSEVSESRNSDLDVGLYGDVALYTALLLLTGRQYFFITGHANSFSKIDVTASFVGFHDVHSEWAKLRSVVLVAINTFGTQIVSWASCWVVSTQLSPLEDGGGADQEEAVDHTFTALLCMIWQGLAALLASICAAVHRRHLMMWAIFAPKFCFEGIAFFISCAMFMFVIAWNYAIRNCGGVADRDDSGKCQGKSMARKE